MCFVRFVFSIKGEVISIIMRSPVSKEKSIKPNDISKVVSLFTEKGWKIQEDNDFQKSEFNNFCNMLSYLDEDEREVILELTKQFRWVNYSQYIPLFQKTFKKFCDSYDFGNISHIIICPLLPEKDFDGNKSSQFLLHLIIADIQNLHNYCAVHSIPPITYIEHPKRAKKCYDTLISSIMDCKKPFFCLVDDFIGSGQTAIEAIHFLLENGFKPSDFAILSLVAMKEGLSRIQENGYIVFSYYEEQKGITGTVHEHEWKQIMLNIENRIKVKPEYSLGYAHSEALIKMLRTPNNTFPVYWLNNKNNPFAPFPR